MVRKSTTPGYVNRNGQVVIRDTGVPGNDHGQRTYVLGCSACGHIYGANGSDIFERKCPLHQSGKEGLPIPDPLLIVRSGALHRIMEENHEVLGRLAGS